MIIKQFSNPVTSSKLQYSNFVPPWDLTYTEKSNDMKYRGLKRRAPQFQSKLRQKWRAYPCWVMRTWRRPKQQNMSTTVEAGVGWVTVVGDCEKKLKQRLGTQLTGVWRCAHVDKQVNQLSNMPNFMRIIKWAFCSYAHVVRPFIRLARKFKRSDFLVCMRNWTADKTCERI